MSGSTTATTPAASARSSRSERSTDRTERLDQNGLWRGARVKHADAVRLAGGELVVGRGYARQEVLARLLKAVGGFSAHVLAGAPDRRVDTQQQRQVRLDAPGPELVDRAHGVDAEPAPGALVGERGVDEAVEQDELAALQRRAQALLDELRAGGGVEQRL